MALAQNIDHLKNEKYNCKNLDLSSIKIFLTGYLEVLNVYENIKDVHLASIAGRLSWRLVLGNLFLMFIKGQSQAIDTFSLMMKKVRQMRRRISC